MAKKTESKNSLETIRGLFTSKKPNVRATTWTLTVVLALGIFYLAYSLMFIGKVYPHVYIGGQSLSGLSQEEVKTKVAELVAASNNSEITFQHAEHSQRFNLEAIEWQVNTDATANKVFAYGRNQERGVRSFIEQLTAVLTRVEIEPVSFFDQDLLNAQISSFADKVDQPAQNAAAEVTDDEIITTQEKAGERINPDEIRRSVAFLLNDLAAGIIVIPVERHHEEPTIILGNTEELKSQVDALAQARLQLKWPTGTKSLNERDIRQLVGFTGTSSQISGRRYLAAAFTDDSIKSYLESIASEIDRPAVEPQLVVKDGKLSIAKASKAGVITDLSLSSTRMLDALESGQDNPVVELAMKDAQPTITESNLSSLGIVERIGFGETSFAGSPTNRRHNINNGVSLLQSALIKPGEEFSTVTKLGAVDASTGFLPELVIKENRTTPEFGGGLCQVSTTLFRSVMNAGLKVTERQNHSYRVSYYEPPVGLDATIYLPKPDFKFRNDTPAHILVQGRVVGSKVIFELWGKSDGRVSQISDPQILSTTPSGEPIYADTDTLPKGEVKQIEKAHDGAVTIAYYTVTRNGEVINKQTFKSIYKPWPARFLVGTNESLLPPPPQP